MQLTPSTWAQLPDGALLVGPSGRVWQLAGRGVDGQNQPYVDLRDPEDGERNSIHVNPHDPVQHLHGGIAHAAYTLAQFFKLERI